jgi:hypothetical protein
LATSGTACSVEFGHRSASVRQAAHDGGLSKTNMMSCAGVSLSALLLLHFLSLAAGTQSRTDDQALRPALHEVGSCVVFKENRSRDSTIHRPRNLPRRTACAKRLIGMRFVLSGTAVCVLTAVRFPVPSGICPCGHVPTGLALLFSAGYTLAAFGGSLRENSQADVVSLAALRCRSRRRWR